MTRCRCEVDVLTGQMYVVKWCLVISLLIFGPVDIPIITECCFHESDVKCSR